MRKSLLLLTEVYLTGFVSSILLSFLWPYMPMGYALLVSALVFEALALLVFFRILSLPPE